MVKLIIDKYILYCRENNIEKKYLKEYRGKEILNTNYGGFVISSTKLKTKFILNFFLILKFYKIIFLLSQFLLYKILK